MCKKKGFQDKCLRLELHDDVLFGRAVCLPLRVQKDFSWTVVRGKLKAFHTSCVGKLQLEQNRAC